MLEAGSPENPREGVGSTQNNPSDPTVARMVLPGCFPGSPFSSRPAPVVASPHLPGWLGGGARARVASSALQALVPGMWCGWWGWRVTSITPWLRRLPRPSASDVVARRPSLFSEVFQVRLPAPRTRS